MFFLTKNNENDTEFTKNSIQFNAVYPSYITDMIVDTNSKNTHWG